MKQRIRCHNHRSDELMSIPFDTLFVSYSNGGPRRRCNRHRHQSNLPTYLTLTFIIPGILLLLGELDLGGSPFCTNGIHNWAVSYGCDWGEMWNIYTNLAKIMIKLDFSELKCEKLFYYLFARLEKPQNVYVSWCKPNTTCS